MNMAFEESQLEQIGSYVKTHLPEWISEVKPGVFYDRELIERSIRSEEGIRNLSLQMDSRFEAMQLQMDSRFEAMQLQMDKRFDQMDKRFEQVDKRFESLQFQMDKRFNRISTFIFIGFSLMAFLITAMKFIQF